MTRARVRDDLARIVLAARELVDGELDYDRSLREYVTDLLRAHDGNADAIWSIDGVHLEYLRPNR